jgi:hypothetical protein
MGYADGQLILRKTTDANFEHCAKTLVPHCVEAIRGIRDIDIDLNHKFGVKEADFINCIHILAEVALAFSHERYGKPRIPVPAVTVDVGGSHDRG